MDPSVAAATGCLFAAQLLARHCGLLGVTRCMSVPLRRDSAVASRTKLGDHSSLVTRHSSLGRIYPTAADSFSMTRPRRVVECRPQTAVQCGTVPVPVPVPVPMPVPVRGGYLLSQTVPCIPAR
ncbi:hypothetical protein V9T40_000242 [Parthenolecanium corni]|uniref:Uncharacterized protein n=1 Tax=Parthenolecanium corni TaxID=536013 RepID=A0AAN9Y1I9_9HEMI